MNINNSATEQRKPCVWSGDDFPTIDAKIVPEGESTDVRVGVMERNDDQDPTVVLSVGINAEETVCMSARLAELLGVSLIQAAKKAES